jgi:hypothetical protein
MGLFDFVKDAGEGLLGKLTGSEAEDSKAVQGRVQDLGLEADAKGPGQDLPGTGTENSTSGLKLSSRADQRTEA